MPLRNACSTWRRDTDDVAPSAAGREYEAARATPKHMFQGNMALGEKLEFVPVAHPDKAEVVESLHRYVPIVDLETVKSMADFHPDAAMQDVAIQLLLALKRLSALPIKAEDALPEKLRNMMAAHLDGIYRFSAREDCDKLLDEVFNAALGITTKGGE